MRESAGWGKIDLRASTRALIAARRSDINGFVLRVVFATSSLLLRTLLALFWLYLADSANVMLEAQDRSNEAMSSASAAKTDGPGKRHILAEGEEIRLGNDAYAVRYVAIERSELR